SRTATNFAAPRRRCPLWISGLPAPDSGRSLRQATYPQPPDARKRHPAQLDLTARGVAIGREMGVAVASDLTRFAPPSPLLNTPCKRTISAMGVWHGRSRGRQGATGRREATACLWCDDRAQSAA